MWRRNHYLTEIDKLIEEPYTEDKEEDFQHALNKHIKGIEQINSNNGEHALQKTRLKEWKAAYYISNIKEMFEYPPINDKYHKVQSHIATVSSLINTKIGTQENLFFRNCHRQAVEELMELMQYPFMGETLGIDTTEYNVLEKWVNKHIKALEDLGGVEAALEFKQELLEFHRKRAETLNKEAWMWNSKKIKEAKEEARRAKRRGEDILKVIESRNYLDPVKYLITASVSTTIAVGATIIPYLTVSNLSTLRTLGYLTYQCYDSNTNELISCIYNNTELLFPGK